MERILVFIILSIDPRALDLQKKSYCFNEKMVSFLSFVFLTLLVQLSYAVKFSELEGKDLRGDTVSFEKYEGKCVLFLQLSPAARRPETQVDELNQIYDKYNGRGLEVVAISTRRLDRITQRFEKMNPHFDIYTADHNREYIRFLRTQRMRLNAFGNTFQSFAIKTLK